MKKFLMFFLICLFVSVSAFAQTKTVTGKIIGSDDNLGLPASVQIKGTTKGVSADIDGNYSIAVDRGQTLVISAIGYTAQEIMVGDANVIDVTLQVEAAQLSEAVVTALGIRREKKALGYSVQDVKGESLIENRTANVITSLSGKVAGLNITATSVPGGSNRIVLRGNSSIGGNNMPLIVIDGVPFDNFQGVDGTEAVAWGAGFTDWGDGLSMLNADDIESVSTLKGPSAAALYGTRGANGVMLITTKKGKAGDKATVTYNTNFTFENVLIQPEFQNEYGQGTGGVYVNTSRNSWGPAMGTIVTDWTGQTRPLTAKNNDYSDFMNTGINWTNSFDISQAKDKINYRIGVSHSIRNGVIPNNKFKNTNVTARIGSEILPKLTLDAKITYSNQKGQNRPEFSASGFNPIFPLIYTPRSINLHEMKTLFNENETITDWYPWATTTPPLTVVNNPYVIANLTGNSDKTNRVTGYASLKYDFTGWLDLTARYGIDTYDKNMYKWYRHNLVSSATYVNGRFHAYTQNFTEANADFLLSAHKNSIFDSKFSVEASFGGNIMHRTSRSTTQDAIGLNIPELYTIGNAMQSVSLNYQSTKEIQSVYGFARVSYDDYLFLDVTARNDWSSTLPSDAWSFFYPSVSLSWVVTDMLKKLDVNTPKWLQYAKLRVSYAEAGNDTDSYQLQDILETVSNMTGGNMGAYLPSTKPHMQLRPETSKSWEFGVEGRFFNGRFGFDITYYNAKTYDQIIALPVSITTGYAARMVNAGRIDNKGWEIQLTGAPVKTKDWNWNLGINFAKNKSLVAELSEGFDTYVLAQPMGQNIQVVAKVGEPYGQMYTNDFKYDQNGNRLVGDDGRFIVDGALRATGNMNPDWTAGISSSLTWKNFSFGFLIDIRKGGDIYLQSMMRLQSNGQTKETVPGRAEYYATGKGLISQGVNVNTGLPNTVELDPTTYWGQFYGNIGNYIYDATNVRVREVSLGYALPKEWFAKTPINSMKLSIVGNNLFFIYNALPGFDPECTYSTGNAQGVETASLPSTRTIGFNLNIVF
ncbi:MAG: SusC/RagA family TonB-linked outer membrane protein [Prevotellaceae bacterium]|jgi:TonB-linked SusC/RagA family outer membrane protein|nr:SusC/RagA family TonB-linked outer membrane protein [Prevotellaceae bacterium]